MNASAILTANAASVRTPPKELFKNRLREGPLTVGTIEFFKEKDRASSIHPGFAYSGWPKFYTELAKYSYGALKEPCGEGEVKNVPEYMRALLGLVANPEIADVGAGSAIGWASFSKSHGINLTLTSLTPEKVVEECRHQCIYSLAGDLWRHFDASSLDLLITHFGPYGQLLSFVENAMHLLKAGRDMILSHGMNVVDYWDMMKVLGEHDNKLYRIMSTEEENTREFRHGDMGDCYNFTIQLRKLADP